MEYFAKIVDGFYFRKRLHLRWKTLPIFARRPIFNGWYGIEYVSGVCKYTWWKVGKFCRTALPINLETADKYLKSSRFHKDHITDFYSKFTNFWQRNTSCFMLWPTDQNSLNFLHLCINSLTIYTKPRAEATVRKAPLKAVTKPRGVPLNSCFVFFFKQNSQGIISSKTSFLINFGNCSPVTLLKRQYFSDLLFIECL